MCIRDRVRIVQDADYIYREEVDKAVEAYKKENGKAPAWMPNQYFAALTNMRSVGAVSYTHLGAVCQLSGEGGVLLVDVYDNGAGYQAGLRSGDRVVNVDGRDITGMELSSAVALIKGDKGTSVTLEVIRGTERLTFSAVRDAVEAKTVSYTLLDNNIGCLLYTSRCV